MVRKISFLLLSLGILYFGYTSFKNLSFWERSIRIFKYDAAATFQGRGGRGGFEGRGDFPVRGGSQQRRPSGGEGFQQPGASGRGFQRPQPGGVPDSLMRVFQERRGNFEGRRGGVTDTLRRENSGTRFERPGTFEETRNGEARLQRPGNNREMRGGERGGRGGFPGGRKINLRSVYWFLAVFAAFTVLVIYIDKAVCLIKKKSGM